MIQFSLNQFIFILIIGLKLFSIFIVLFVLFIILFVVLKLFVFIKLLFNSSVFNSNGGQLRILSLIMIIFLYIFKRLIKYIFIDIKNILIDKVYKYIYNWQNG